MTYKIIDHNGFLAVAHTMAAYDKPELVTVAWLSKVKTSDNSNLIDTIVSPNGPKDDDKTGWDVSTGGGFIPRYLWTDRLSTPISRVPIKPPRKRKGRPWKWDGASGRFV